MKPVTEYRRTCEIIWLVCYNYCCRCTVVSLVEKNRSQHGAKEQGQATSQPLYSGKTTLRRALEHREPDVTVSQILPCLCPEQVVEAGQFLGTCYWYNAVNLNILKVEVESVQHVLGMDGTTMWSCKYNTTRALGPQQLITIQSSLFNPTLLVLGQFMLDIKLSVYQIR